jgi:hypothetical protein
MEIALLLTLKGAKTIYKSPSGHCMSKYGWMTHHGLRFELLFVDVGTKFDIETRKASLQYCGDPRRASTSVQSPAALRNLLICMLLPEQRSVTDRVSGPNNQRNQQQT